MRIIRKADFRPFFWLVVIGVTGMAIPGCGNSTTTVSGTVKLQTTPVNWGFVEFYNEQDEMKSSAMINPDGTYTALAVPMGNVKVAVKAVKGAGMDKMPQGKAPPVTPVIEGVDPGKKVYVPASYADPKTSGLNYTIESANQTVNIEIK